jgi:uncharacterized protein (TIGR03437 family)
MAFDGTGNLYFFNDAGTTAIRKITPAGFVNTVFSSPLLSGLNPGIATDTAGHLYALLTNDTVVRLDAIPPVLSAVSPPAVSVGGTAVPLLINGSGFDVDSVVRWNGSALPTTYLNATELAVTIPASDLATAQQASVSVLNPALGGAASNSLTVNVTTGPVFTAASVVNGADFLSGIAPGEIVSIFGSNLATGVFSAQALPLPTTLGGASLALNGMPMPLFYVSPTQINAQVPFLAASGPLSIRTSVTATQTVSVVPIAPGIFTTNGTQGVIVNADYTLADASHPAVSGSLVTMYCTGLGAVTPAVQEGAAAPVPPATTLTVPLILVGPSRQYAQVTFSGLSPGSAGLYQLNFMVPAGIAPSTVNVQLYSNGVVSNIVTMAVQNPP